MVRRSASSISAGRIGLGTKSSIPDSKHFCRSCVMAPAVSAISGRSRSRPGTSPARTRRATSKPSTTGIWQSSSTPSKRRAASAWSARSPFPAISTVWPILASRSRATIWLAALSSATSRCSAPRRFDRRLHRLARRRLGEPAHGQDRQFQLEPEGRAPPRLALEADLAAHEMHQLAANCQPQARAAEAPARRSVALGERLEEPGLHGGRNADARVAHRHAKGCPPARGVHPADAHRHFARVGELDRVAHEVDDHLADAARIGLERRRQPGIEFAGEDQLFFARPPGQERQRLVDHLPEVDLAEFEPELARLDLGEIENVVDDGQQAFGARLDDLPHPLLLRVERRSQEQPGHADDAVHRGADLVAHAREEFGLGARGLDRLVPGVGHVLLGGAARRRHPSGDAQGRRHQHQHLQAAEDRDRPGVAFHRRARVGAAHEQGVLLRLQRVGQDHEGARDRRRLLSHEPARGHHPALLAGEQDRVAQVEFLVRERLQRLRALPLHRVVGRELLQGGDLLDDLVPVKIVAQPEALDSRQRVRPVGRLHARHLGDEVVDVAPHLIGVGHLAVGLNHLLVALHQDDADRHQHAERGHQERQRTRLPLAGTHRAQDRHRQQEQADRRRQGHAAKAAALIGEKEQRQVVHQRQQGECDQDSPVTGRNQRRTHGVEGKAIAQPNSRSPTAVFGAMRPGELWAYTYWWCHRSSSIPKDRSRRYCARTAMPNAATSAPPIRAIRGNPSASFRRLPPPTAMQTAVFITIAAPPGRMVTRICPLVIQPTTTVALMAITAPPNQQSHARSEGRIKGASDTEE